MTPSIITVFVGDGVLKVEKVISKKMAIYIISGSVILLIVIGSLIGYRFFWNQYDTRSSSDKKISQLEEQLILKPKDIINQLDLGWMYIQEEKYQQAEDQFKSILKKDKQNYDARFGLANAYISLEKYKQSETILRALLEEKSGDAEVLHSLGIVLREQKKYPEAEQVLLSALNINKISADVLYDLALVYEKMNNKEKAIEHFQKSVAFVPSFTEAYEGLERLGVKSYTPPEANH